MSESYAQLSLFADRRFKSCAQCGNPFRVKPNLYDIRVYCSRACMSIAYRQRLTGAANPNFREASDRTCEFCGAQYASFDKDRRFCSSACYHKATVENNPRRVPCGYCGNKFISYKPNARFCSPVCLHEDRQRKKALAVRQPTPVKPRDCRHCGESFVPDAHWQWQCERCHTRTCAVCGSVFRVMASHQKKTCSPACNRERRAAIQLGERSHRWQGGKTKETLIVRGSLRYTKWREAVFARDDFSCQLCGKRGGRLSAHHIKRFAEHSELAFEVWNGISLCWPCHASIRHKEAEYEDQFFSVTRPEGEKR